jgi:hypothetical protein
MNQKNKKVKNDEMNPMDKKKTKSDPHHTRVSLILSDFHTLSYFIP